MIIVTGTKRSGTSMWMQVLRAGGFPLFGDAFPRNWSENIAGANPAGFFESTLREGIYYRTNPHPKTGEYVFPDQVRRHVVKVFIPGVVRTDRAFIGRVVGTMRPWREYCQSLERLNAMEDEAAASSGRTLTRPPAMPPELEWWQENFALIRDVNTRRYPFHLVSYDAMLRDPAATVRDTFGWIGEGDVGAAVRAVRPEHRTQARAAYETELPPSVTTIFDELYECVDHARPLPKSMVKKLNETAAALAPRVQHWMRETLAHQHTRRGEMLAADSSAPLRPGGDAVSEPSESR